MDARRRLLTIAAAVAALAGLAAAAILINLTLLGIAQPNDDPVGKLSPRAVLPAVSTATPPLSPPTVTISTGGTGHRQGDEGELRDD